MADPAKKPGVNWGALMNLVAPVVGDIASGGDRGAFMDGFLRAQQRAEDAKMQQAAADQQRKATGADYLLKIGEHAQGIEDPIDFENFLTLAEQAGTSAGYVEPGALKSGVTFNRTKYDAKQADAVLNELTKELAALEGGPHPFDLDELAASGATIRLKNGKTVPVSTAIEMTNRRPLSAGGQAVARPKKAPTDPGTSDYARALARFATSKGKTTETLTTADELEFKKLYGQADDRPAAPRDPRIDELNLTLKELQVQAAKDKAAGGNALPKRRMLSSDVNRISELDTSLNDVNVLEQEIGTTGASSKIGALLPNVVTEFTGWGTDAKQRQAVIDRVKQVIGKALEGGVLRKEDEYKYVKILPTIGDPPAVARTKIAGLKAALELRRQTTLEALDDADFDVSKFTARTAAKGTLAANEGPKDGDTKPIDGFPGTEQTYRKGKWIRTK
jgi:hypothetical protein